VILLLHAGERERDDGAGRFAYVGEQRRCVEVALQNGQ
jgi:hypothetical protein